MESQAHPKDNLPTDPSAPSGSQDSPTPPEAPEPNPSAHPLLGEVMVDAGLVTTSHVEVALVDQVNTGYRIGEIMVLRGWIDQPTVESMVEVQKSLGGAEETTPLPPDEEDQEIDPHDQAGQPEDDRSRIPKVNPSYQMPPIVPPNQVVLGSELNRLNDETVTMDVDEVEQVRKAHSSQPPSTP